MVWLHGTVFVRIEEARNIPLEVRLEGPDCSSETAVVRALSHLQRKVGMTKPSDTYCVVLVGRTRRARTRVIQSNSHPRWDAAFPILVADVVDHVDIQIKDADGVGSTTIGTIRFNAATLLKNQQQHNSAWFPVVDPDGALLLKTEVKMQITFRPFRVLRGLRDGLGPVPDVYFPMRQGCRVRLYNDAHQEPGQRVPLANGRVFESRSLWTDMYTDIAQARHFIYITGWSVEANVQMVRHPDQPQAHGVWPTLGQMLLRKADSGVRVLVMPWQDRHNVMGTHDQATLKYFEGTKVICQLSMREAADVHGHSWAAKWQTSTFFTHHQKAVILDGPGLDGATRVVAYVGGVDLTMGRYDTAQHPLFRTLTGCHSADFYQASFRGAPAEQGGPRQPWHDIHCRLEGPAAHDVLHNFEQRWGNGGGKGGHILDMAAGGIPTGRRKGAGPAFNNDPRLFVTSPQDPEGWNVQVFRSIDSDSVPDFPAEGHAAASLGLFSDKSSVVDSSIQKAYIHAIRRAQHFIYIENQYFIGSSHLWDKNTSAGSVHLIPAELALKIVSKIKARQRFAVVVVMPLFPEGHPKGNATQEILRFQYNTMCMMYKIIAAALRGCGRGATERPQDYLAFFCLGNREPLWHPSEQHPVQPPNPQSYHARAQASRRGMIYVHSKMMIVDDEYIILGSANINQRSMDGSRDTEIAMGAFQPGHLAGHTVHELPKGEIHGFRMTLWLEHVGAMQPCFLDPTSVECMRKLRAIGDTNWAAYASPMASFMDSHLMTYPVRVTDDGRVESLEGHHCLPDTAVPVIGLASYTLPDMLTT